MIVYEATGAVSILKRTVCPLLTLISVANPCMVRSPAPLISHVDLGVPAKAFSVTIGFWENEKINDTLLKTMHTTFCCRLNTETSVPWRTSGLMINKKIKGPLRSSLERILCFGGLRKDITLCGLREDITTYLVQFPGSMENSLTDVEITQLNNINLRL